MNKDKNETIAIIDGNSLTYRAFFAIKNPMVTSRGIFTQAIYGFLNMLTKAFSDVNPAYAVVAFDRKAPTFRHLEYDAYKAGRAKTPDELSMQLPYLKEILAAMSISVIEMDGFEADDLIGTVAKRAEEAGLAPLIITGDRDELQLVTERTNVLITKKGVSEFELYTPESMREKYGFGAELFVDYKGLMGDTSDNIPGLPGVGEKTAAGLVKAFGSIESILERLDEVTPVRIRGIVDENRSLALMSKRLATIVTDVPIELDFDDMRVREWDVPRLRKVYTELEFRTFLKKLDSMNSGGEVPGSPVSGSQGERAHENTPLPAIDISPDVHTTVIDDPAGLDVVCDILDKAAGAGEETSVVLHTVGSCDHVEEPLVYAIYLYVAGENTQAEYICIITRGDMDMLARTARILLARSLRFIGHGLQNDLYRLRIFDSKAEFDTGVANYLLAPGGSEPTFAQICLTYGGVTVSEEPDLSSNILAYANDDLTAYGLQFCAAAYALKEPMRELLARNELTKLFDEVEMPLVSTLAEIEANGFSFDASALSDISSEINTRVEELTDSITELAGEPFNINSPKQLGEILFDKLGLKGSKKNKNGWSTSADILEKLRFESPIIGQVLEYRTLVKLRGTYIDGLPSFVSADGRIRPHLQQTVTATGRLSCTDPNLQNIPIRQEYGRLVRKAFKSADEGYSLMGADYSQIELRILAHLSGDPALIDDFMSGADIHSRTAARVFGVADEAEVTTLQRSAAKAVNFGIIYGMSSFGLSEELSISRKDAERYIAEYFAQHTAVKAYMDECVRLAKERGYSVTLLGRRRQIPEIGASQYQVRQLGERLAMNSPVQGSAADIIKIAMNRVRAALAENGLKSKLILQVHDELILEVPSGEEEAAARILKDEMENAVVLSVPLVAEVKTGKSWYDLK